MEALVGKAGFEPAMALVEPTDLQSAEQPIAQLPLLSSPHFKENLRWGEARRLVIKIKIR